MANIAAYEAGLRDPNVRARRAQYFPLVQQYANKYKIPVALMDGIIMNESRYDPNARGPTDDHGIAQFTTKTARGMGVKPYDVNSALDGAARLIKQGLTASGGDWGRVAQFYNSGKLSGAPLNSSVASYMKYANDLRAKYGDGKSVPTPDYTPSATAVAGAGTQPDIAPQYTQPKPLENVVLSNIQSGMITPQEQVHPTQVMYQPSARTMFFEPDKQLLNQQLKQWSTWS